MSSSAGSSPDRPDPAENAEELAVIARIVAAALDDTSATYSAMVATRLDDDTLTAIRAAVHSIRRKYRTAREFRNRLALVSALRSEDPGVAAALEDDCALCLRPLTSARLIRLRASNSTLCGHFFHAACIAGWESANQRAKRCPLCRADVVGTWHDHESDVPLF